AGVVGDERGAGRSLAHHDAHAVGEEEEDQVVAEPTRVPGVSQLEEVDPGHGAATLALRRQPHDPEGNEPGIGAVTHHSGEPRVGAASAAYPGRLDVEDFGVGAGDPPGPSGEELRLQFGGGVEQEDEAV